MCGLFGELEIALAVNSSLVTDVDLKRRTASAVISPGVKRFFDEQILLGFQSDIVLYTQLLMDNDFSLQV